MGDKFSNLDSDKQQKIINAALKEFTINGYELASTNQIVEEAGISKGSLFYYFKTKKELYKYLVEYSIDYVSEKYLNKLDYKEQDLIEKYRKMSKQKLQAYSANPHVFNFLGTIYMQQGQAELPDDLLQKLIETKEESVSKIFNNLDLSLFRDDIPAEQIIKLIRWSVEGYEKELINGLQGKKLPEVDLDPYWDEFHEFLDTLKKIYYRE